MTDTLAVTEATDSAQAFVAPKTGAKVRTSITLDPALLDLVKAESSRLARDLGQRDSVSSFIENLVRAHFEGSAK
jgi:hypothetical protein